VVRSSKRVGRRPGLGGICQEHCRHRHDSTTPPTGLQVAGNTLTWDAEADPESGLTGFAIERDGKRIATLPERQRNPYGRPLFQGLLYSDTPPSRWPRCGFHSPVTTQAVPRPIAFWP
jgi:hypothetical protein